MSSFTVSLRTEGLLARLRGAEGKLREQVRAALQRLAISAQGKVKGDKLTGQVLHVRSGTLRRSINQQIVESGGGIFAKIGTNLRYAAIHEYGFNGTEHVKAHARRSVRQMAISRTKRVRKSEGETQVRAFDRHMVMPERSFLRSTVNEMSGEIKESLRAAVLKALR